MLAESFFELLFFPPPPREVMTETEMGMPVPELAIVSATDISDSDETAPDDDEVDGG